MLTTLTKICVPPSTPIRQAIHVLQATKGRIVLVTSPKGRLIGVLADGDVRRAILRGVSLDLPVSQIMVRRPVVGSLDMSDADLICLMQSKNCYEIPILDGARRVVGLRNRTTLLQEEQKTEVVIMAGGLSTRLRPLTHTTPKPLVHVGDRPILFILLDQLIQHGFCRITLSLHYMADLIKNAVRANPDYRKRVGFIYEKNRLGTAGALSLLKRRPAGPFLVINADILTKVNFNAMLHFHELEGNDMTVAVRNEQTQLPFGSIRLKGTRVVDIEEKPVHSYFANSGVYVLNPSVLRFVPKNSFYDMTDLISDLILAKRRVGSFPIHEYWLDIGRHEELAQAQKDVLSF